MFRSRLFLAGILLVLPISLVLEAVRRAQLTRDLRSAVASGDATRLEHLLKRRRALEVLERQDDSGLSIRDGAEDAQYPDLVDVIVEAGGSTRSLSFAMRATKSFVEKSAIVTGLWKWLPVVTVRAPALSVLVVKDHKTLFEHISGYVDTGTGARADVDTRFPISSVTKQFIAAAIMRMQDEGLLDVRKDRLSRWFPDFPRGAEVTLEHLLTHTSGIRSYTDEPGMIGGGFVSKKDLLAIMSGLGYAFNPGDYWEYCNSGFALLGFIVEAVSGEELGKHLGQTFFKPLGMTRTGLLDEADVLNETRVLDGMLGYRPGKFPWSRPYEAVPGHERLHISLAAGAGAMYSTARDLARWNEAMFGDSEEIMSNTSRNQTLTPILLNDGTTWHDYGYGWSIPRPNEYEGVVMYGHGGGQPGYSSFLSYYPSAKLSIVVLSNSHGGKVSSHRIGASLREIWKHELDLASGRPVDPQVDSNVGKEQLSKFVGKYEVITIGCMKGAPLKIRQKGNTLSADGWSLDHEELIAVAPNRVVASNWRPKISFTLSPKDRSEYGDSLIIERASPGRKAMVARRMSSKNQCGGLWGQKLNSVELQSIRQSVGLYDYGYGGTLIRFARFRRHALVAEVPVMPGYKFHVTLLHMGNLTFCISGEAYLEVVKFHFGKDGGATHVSFHQSGYLPRDIRRRD